MEFFDNAHVRGLNNLELLARQVVEGFIIGMHKSPFHGFSVEFAEHRIYNQGESTKNIDWKVYARTDKLYSKRFEEETNLRCQIVIDTSSSMYFPDYKTDGVKTINKLQYSALGAASLMNLLRKQRDAFGLSLFDQTVNEHTPSKSSMSHYRLMLTYLDRVLKAGKPEQSTSAAHSLHQIADSIHKRSLVILFSDMFENTENHNALFSALQHLKHNKHEVIVFHVVDHSKEIEFEYENRPYLFVDMETGEKLRLQPKEIEVAYKKKMNSYLNELNLKCLQYKIDFVNCDIQKGYNEVLQTYLAKRNKMSA